MKTFGGLTAALILIACATSTTPTSLPAPTGTPAASATATPTSAPTTTPTVAPTATPGATPSPTRTPTVSPSAAPSPSTSPSPTASASAALSSAEVRYLLIDQLGPLHYCDPDEYPVAVDDEQQKAIAKFPDIQADSATFDAIAERAGLTGKTTFSDADKLQVYREWKVLMSVDASVLANQFYEFDVTTEGDAASGQAIHYLGNVDAMTGQVFIGSQEDVFGVSCPI